MYAFLNFLSLLLRVYSFLLIVKICLTWIPNQRQSDFSRVLNSICDPYLNFFRKAFYKGGQIDFSPMFALVTLNVARSILNLLTMGIKLTLGSVITIIYTTLWSSVFSFLLIVLIVILIFRLSLEGKADPMAQNTKQSMDNMLNSIMHTFYRIFYKGRFVTDKNLLKTALISCFVLLCIGSALGSLLRYLFF